MSGQENILKDQADQYAKEKKEISEGINAANEKAEELQNRFQGFSNLYKDKQSRL